MKGYRCKLPELECIASKSSNTTLDKCNQYCVMSELPRGITLSFAYSPTMYLFSKVIGYESKLQYPFPKEYGFILQDDKRIELSDNVDDHEVKELKTEFYDIRENKPYILANIAYIVSGGLSDNPHLLYHVLHKGIKYSITEIEEFNIQQHTAKIEDDRKDPIISMNKEFIDLLHSNQDYYSVYSTSNFLKDFRNALESEEISIFYITIIYKSGNSHANAIVVCPHLHNIYYIEPAVEDEDEDEDDGINIHILDRLKTITDHQPGRAWGLRHIMQIQGDDSFCASWVQICVVMIIANPGIDGTMLIRLLMSNRTYSLRYTILILWMYYVRKRLTQGHYTVEYCLHPNNKDTVIGEYKKHYSNFTDDEIEKKYNDDIPLMGQILEILNTESAMDPDYLLNENNIQLPEIN